MASTPARTTADVADTERPPPPDAVAESTEIGPPPSPGGQVGPPTPFGLAVANAHRSAVQQRAATPGAAFRPATRRCTSCGAVYPDDFVICPRDATPLAAAEGHGEVDPLVGTLVGGTYQIVRVIGEGGMGRVYEARHLRLKERRFAVKCLHADLAKNPEMAARFLREAETASSIEHPNVVDVFDVHHLADGTPYMVGEFLEGEELAAWVKARGPLDPRTAAKVGRQVCQALAAAHERGVVHRDMKPENIFVLSASIGGSIAVKVLDFGISKAKNGDTSHLTKTGVVLGTPSYMAPEQARGRPVDRRADVYSLGACLYFMVTGRRPFDSDDPASTLSMVLTQDPARPREIDPRIPENLELVIQRAMAKDPADRYGSMDELDRALTVSSGRPSLAVPGGMPVSASMAPPAWPPARPEGQTSARRAFDAARALFAKQAPAQQSARMARPKVVVTSIVLGLFLAGGGVSALAGLVRVLHDGEVTLTESLLLCVGCLVAAATPAGLYVMHLRKVVWPNSVRAVQLADDLERVTLAALLTYGGASIFVRILHTVFIRSSGGLASGLWDLALFVASVGVASFLGGPGLVRSKRHAGD